MLRFSQANRLAALFIALNFVAIGTVYYFINDKNSYLYGMTADSAVYILMADFYSPYFSGARELYPFLREQYPFPPFFSLAMALLGGGSESPFLSYMLSSAFLFLTLIVFYFWNKRILGSRVYALFLVAAFAFMPNTISQLTIIQSEHLYLLLTMAAFLAYQDARSDRLKYFTGLLFSLVSVTRTVGIIAIIAYGIVLARKDGIKKAIVIGSLSVAPLLAWVLYKSFHGGGPGYLQVFSDSVSGGVVDNLLSQVKVNTQLIWIYWIRLFDNHILLHSAYAIGLVTFFMFCGLLMRAFRVELDALYVTGCLLILIVWPFPAQFERFLYILTPFALTYGVYAIICISKYIRKFPGDLLAYAYFAVIALVVLPSISGAWARFHFDTDMPEDAIKTIEWLQSTNPGEIENQYRFMSRIYNFMQGVNRKVPEDSCIVSTVPAYLMLHSGRKSLKPPSHAVADKVFQQEMRVCEYALMVAVVPRPRVGNPPMYPFHRIKNNFRVVDVLYEDPGNRDSKIIALLARHSI